MNPFRPAPRRFKVTCVRACLLFLGLFHAGSSLAQIDPATEADHARIIQGWNSESFERGRKLYDAICITCHGNLTQPGSLPT